MSHNNVYALYHHTHKNGGDGGITEHVYTHDAPANTLTTLSNGSKYLVLPGVARYNAGYGLVTLALDGKALEPGTDWKESPRMAGRCADASSAYWANSILIPRPAAAGIYRATWRELLVFDAVRGIRAVHTNAQGDVVWNWEKASLLSPTNYPNGVAWDALPDGYTIEIWRKTRHRQQVAAPVWHSGKRWMLWKCVPASKLAVNLEEISGNVGTVAYRLAYLRADGARSLLSAEAIVYHGRGGWGAYPQISGGRVLVK